MCWVALLPQTNLLKQQKKTCKQKKQALVFFFPYFTLLVIQNSLFLLPSLTFYLQCLVDCIFSFCVLSFLMLCFLEPFSPSVKLLLKFFILFSPLSVIFYFAIFTFFTLESQWNPFVILCIQIFRQCNVFF